MERGIDGLSLVGTDYDPQVQRMLATTRTPHLFTWSFDEGRGRGCVGVSNHAATLSIVRHLLDLGHRRMAVLCGDPTHNERARSRLAAVRQALALIGAPLAEDAVFYCSFSIDAGGEAAALALDLPQRPTALICGTDLLAAGALREASARGLNVPRDLSIVGFDDIDFSALLNPPLTTVRVPTQAMGQQAVAELARLIAGGEKADIELATELVVRASTGPPPKLSEA